MPSDDELALRSIATAISVLRFSDQGLSDEDQAKVVLATLKANHLYVARRPAQSPQEGLETKSASSKRGPRGPYRKRKLK